MLQKIQVQADCVQSHTKSLRGRTQVQIICLPIRCSLCTIKVLIEISEDRNQQGQELGGDQILKGVDTCEGKEAVVKRHFMIRRPFYFYSYGKFPSYYCPLTFSSLEKKKKQQQRYRDAHERKRHGFSLKTGLCLRCCL